MGVRGNQLEGLQIDFDAATRGLAHYAAFLSDLRQRLPRRWKLSITGLMDWSAGGGRGDPSALRQLSGTLDKIVCRLIKPAEPSWAMSAISPRYRACACLLGWASSQAAYGALPSALTADPAFER